MDYAKAFARALQALKDEGRYRVFADIRRDRGRFPSARHFTQVGAAADHRVVLQRLRRHGPEPCRAGRHARGTRCGRPLSELSVSLPHCEKRDATYRKLE
jgi:hypothetical protein